MNETTENWPEQERQLMEQALQQTRDYGQQLSATCATISNHFQSGKQQEGITLLHQLLEGLGWVSHAVQLTHPLQIENSISIDLNHLSQVLTPLVGALENKDYGLIGDILVYEVQPILNTWCSELAKTGPDPHAV